MSAMSDFDTMVSVAEQVTEADVLRIAGDPDAAAEFLRNLNDEIRQIEFQLGDRNRGRPDGSRMGGIEYFTWRSKAIAARRHKERLYVALKAHIKRLNRERGERWATSARSLAVAGCCPACDALLDGFR